MIRIELEDFSVLVPVKHEMHVSEFLAIADKLERMAGHAREKKPAAPAVVQSVFKQDSLAATQAPAQMISHLQAQTDHIRKTEQRLEKHEQHIMQILEYLQSVDKHLRK